LIIYIFFILGLDCCENCCGDITNETINENSQDNNVTTIIGDEGDDDDETLEIMISPKDLPFTIVTGASKNHFCPLKSFIYNVYETIQGFNNVNIVIYDLGLSSEQRNEVYRMQEKGYLTELKVFNWTAYPSFWNITKARGEYAWKPGMIHEISKEYPGIIIWLDSGSKAQRHLFENLGKLLDEANGFISPRSPGTMKDWTHPGVYKYFNDDHKKYDNLSNCNGASIIFDTIRTQPLIDAWYKCALDKNCIAPPGSSRKNHRQDQALLTYLAAKEGRFCNRLRGYFGFNIHDDNNCRKEINRFESSH
jgi:hypothetical protein